MTKDLLKGQPLTIKMVNHIIIEHDPKKSGLQNNMDLIYKTGVKAKTMHHL